MLPPEVILDRWIRSHLSTKPEFSGYKGKLNIDGVQPSPLRSFLYLVQESMNEALRLEGVNASGGVEHPPFHFDYLNTSMGIMNAHAFQHGGYAFIAVTLPLIELIWHLSLRISRTPLVLELMRLDPGRVSLDEFHGLLFQIQLSFLVSHEYTNHIHNHCADREQPIEMWTEFSSDASSGSLRSQAQELDADGYASYIVLSHLLHGALRESALAQLCRAGVPDSDGDEVLLMCYLLAVLSFSFAFWRDGLDIRSVSRFTHPHPLVRIKYAIQIAEMWLSQTATTSGAWPTPDKFRALFHVIAKVMWGKDRPAWDVEVSYLGSEEGLQYDRELFNHFEAMRKEHHNVAGAEHSGLTTR